MTEQEQRDLVVKEALSWIGTPYHHQAMIKGVGVDCALILLSVYQTAGVLPEKIEIPEYNKQWNLHRGSEKYINTILKYTTPTETPKPGDVALFKFGRLVSHSAILIDYPNVIHAMGGIGVFLDDMTDGALRNRLHGFYTFWGK